MPEPNLPAITFEPFYTWDSTYSFQNEGTQIILDPIYLTPVSRDIGIRFLNFRLYNSDYNLKALKYSTLLRRVIQFEFEFFS